MRNVRRVHLTDIWSWYRVELRVGDHLGRSEELVSRCVECDLAEPESLASLGGSAPGVVDRILSYPHVLLTSPHEWDPSVLDYSHPNTCGYPSWTPDPSVRDQHEPRIDECGNIHNSTIHTLSILSDTPTIFVKKHDQQTTTIDYNKLKPYFGWVNAETIKKTFENSTQWAVTSTRVPMRKTFQIKVSSLQYPM